MHCKDANLFPSAKPFKQKNNRFKANRLWFAWKIVLLQYRKQLLYLYLHRVGCGGLLEKSYFCSIANNSMPRKASRSGVVICLKNRTFAVSQTTHRMKSSWLLMFLSIKRRLFSLWCQHKTNTLLKHEVQNKSNHRLINSRKTNNSRTHQLTNWKTHKLIHSNLKSLSFILQYHSNFRSVPAKI